MRCHIERLPARMMFSFTPAGVEFPVNTTTSDIQENAVVASDSSGDSVVVWQSHNQDGSGWGIYGRQYNSSGVAQGSEFLINQTTTGDQTLPAVAMDSGGAFVVTWMTSQSGTDDIYARVFASNGTAQTNEFLVSNPSAGNQMDPAVAMDGSGNFVVTYDGQGAGDTSGIFTQAYLANGTAQGGVVLVNSTTTNTQSNPTIAMNASGNYVVAWTDQSGSQPKIEGQLCSAGGVASGSQFLVGTSGNYQEASASAGMDSTGNFTIAWAEQLPSSEKWDVLAGQYNASGSALDVTPLAVNTYTKDIQDLPSLAMRADGHFLVAWESKNQDGNQLGIFAEAFNPNGSVDGGEFQVNTTTNGSQEAPHASWNGGDAVVAWDGQTAADSDGIAARQLATAAAANQSPAASVPGTRSVNEDSTLTFSGTITVADPDGGSGTEQVTLTATHGTIALASLSNLSLTSGTGSGDTTVTFQGALSDLNAALNGVTFTPTSGFTGAAGLSVSIDDLGNTGTGGALTNSRSITINVASVAHTPTVTNATTNENQQMTSGLVISPDPSDFALFGSFQITNITGGTLFQNDGSTQINDGDFISFSQGEAGLAFTPTSNSTTPGSFDVQASTLLGALGLAGSIVHATVTVNPVPQITALPTQTVLEEGALTLSSGNGNAVVVSDAGAPSGTATVTIAASGGTITLADDSLVVLNSGTGTNDASVSFTGAFAALNAALDGMVFTPTAHTFGNASVGISVAEGSNAATSNVAITVTRVAHTPTISSATTNENVQSTSGLVITPNAADSGLSGYFQITGITGGTLFQHNGSTQIHNGNFITFAQGQAGLRFTPTANSIANGSFTAGASISNSIGGLGGSTATATVTVQPAPSTGIIAPQTTLEDTALVFSSANGNGIAVNDPGNPSGSVQITLTASNAMIALATTSGLSFSSGANGTASMTFTGTFPLVNAALDGMIVTPDAHFFGSAGFLIVADEAGNTVSGSASITVTRVAHTLAVSNATTNENTQTNLGLVLTPNSLDSGLSGYFQISSITGGTLFQHDGTTLINNGDFITFAQGQAGLRFTPNSNSTATGSFAAQASTTNSIGGLGGSVISANVTVNGVPLETLPVAQTTAEDASLTLSAANGNAISVNDPGAPGAASSVLLTATGGTITLANTSGVTINSGTGSNDASVSFTGTYAGLNAALDGLIFTPASHTFGTGGIATTTTEGANSVSANLTINVTRVAHTPTISNAATNENVRSNSGLVISPDALDSGLLGYFQVTGITAGTLFQNDGTTQIHNGDFITFAQGQTGLRFTPATNSTVAGSFSAQASTSASAGGLGGSAAMATITVNPVPLAAVPPAQTMTEDVPAALSSAAGNAISVSDPGNPSGTVQVALTGSNTTISLATTGGISFSGGADGTAGMSFSGTFSAVNSALDGMIVTPDTHFFGSAGVSILADEAGNSASGSVAITINRVAHTPGVSATTTNENAQSTSGLIISPDPLDSGLSGYFKITAITGGALFQNDGITPINDGNFISFAEGAAGLRFRPTADSVADGSFIAQAAVSAADAGLGGIPVSATISVIADPVVSVAGGPLVYIEKQSPISIDPTLTLTDRDSSLLSSATVRLVGYVSGEDELDFEGQNGISGAFDSASGVLTLTGSAPVTEYQTALRSVTFVDASLDPATSARSFQITATAGSLSSQTVSRPLQVISVNDAPVITVPLSQQTLEDTPLMLSGSAGNLVTVSDVDGAAGVEQLTVAASGGTVTLAPQNTVQIISGTGSDDAAVTFTGTLAQLNAALDGLTFTPAPNFSGTATLTVAANDLGNTGSGGAQTAIGTVNIDVSRTAHTPSVTDATTVENAISSGGLVITPNSLDMGLDGFYQITEISGGRLFKSDGASPLVDGQFITFAEGAAGVRFKPSQDSVAGGSFSIRAASAADTASLGGHTVSAIITVTPLPLQVKSADLAIYGGTVSAIDNAALSVARIDGAPVALTFQVDALPQHGALRLAGVNLVVGSTFTSDDITSGRLQYATISGNALTDSFVFTAQDAEGATIGPVTLSITSRPTPAVVVPPTPFSSPSPSSTPSSALPVEVAPSYSADSGAGDTSTAAATDAPSGGEHHASINPPPAQSHGAAGLLAPAVASRLVQSVVDEIILSRTSAASSSQDAARADDAEYQQRFAIGLINANAVDPTTSLLLTEEQRHSAASNAPLAALAIQSHLWQDLDSMREKMTSDAPLRVWAGTASVVSMGLPVVYLLYALRAGTMLSSLLSSIPAWRMVDPLPILDHLSADASAFRKEAEDDKGLGDMIAGNIR